MYSKCLIFLDWFKKKENTSYTTLTCIYSSRYMYLLLSGPYLKISRSYNIQFNKTEAYQLPYWSETAKIHTEPSNKCEVFHKAFIYVEINLWLHRTHHLGLRITTLLLFFKCFFELLFEWSLARHQTFSFAKEFTFNDPKEPSQWK